MPAWALLTKAKGRSWESNEGYPDVLGSEYVYDSAVGNHRQVAVGDVVVLRSSETVYGISRIDRIDTESTVKTRLLCPNCGKTGFDRRTSIKPIFRCGSCQHTFDTPNKAEVPIVRYRAGYAQRWHPLDGELTSKQIEPALDNAKQSAIRRCDLDILAGILDGIGVRIPDPVDTSTTSAHSGPASDVNVTAVGDEINATDSATVWKRATVSIPAISDDETLGPDLLGIAPDARALAALLASKNLITPLAVALYGEWGVGKTFFMNQIQAYIDAFTSSDPEGTVFQPGVQHVVFRAWHYERGDLMASLHQHIFETLDLPPETPAEKLQKAHDRVVALAESVATARTQVVAIEGEIDRLGARIETVRIRHEAELESLKSVRPEDIWSAATDGDALRSQFETAAQQMKISEAVDSVRELRDSADEIVAQWSRIRLLGTPSAPRRTSPLLGGLLAGLFVLILTLILAKVGPDDYHAVATSVGWFAAAIAGVATGLSKLSKLISKILAPAERVQRCIARRVQNKKIDQAVELADLEKEVAQKRSELAEACRAKVDALKELDEARRERDDLKPSIVLQRFIADRAATVEYEENLGVTTRILRDLRNLCQHLSDAIAEPEARTKRVVLYIDDLDRCSTKTVVAVLEAVHLFLGLPHFVVVMGVAPRSLDRSLRACHPELLESGDCAPTPSDYLEKIFQLTFTLPPMSPEGCRAILREVVDRNDGPIPRSGSTEVLPDDQINEVPGPDETDSAGDLPGTSADGVTTEQDSPAGHFDAMPDELLTESLALSESDREILDLVAPLVATTPRRAKRFVTVYTVVRARLSAEPHDPAALAVLVAALLGAPETLGCALRHCDAATETAESFGNWAESIQYPSVATLEGSRVAAFLAKADRLLDLPMETVLANRHQVLPYTIGITNNPPLPGNESDDPADGGDLEVQPFDPDSRAEPAIPVWVSR
ncbi:hypothetical protein F5X71_08450 [Nocardia brasiliensis]|uniref:KAP NTPase domain-containing protein n=1 Tax=Nocardia brasiliensis TaxID=37326 RepID=A0A6G9XN72_NOCBR|nr:P-loop NTPase fold protein [Nocardia brasiliensis]QIS02349.1 hypothetical protein F5X71_08450 [Nocardia brasiliensis]